MRRIIDLMAITGFLLSSSMTAALVISYLQFDKLMDESVERIGGQVTEKIEGEIKGKLNGAATPSLF